MDREKLTPSVLGSGEIGHPFRQSLPIEMIQRAQKDRDLETALPTKGKWLGEDASLFVLSFLAFFTAFYTFIF